MRGRWWMGWIMAVATVTAVSEAGAQSVILPRPGQVGVGGYGTFGTLLKSGDLGDLFDLGPGLGVTVRYRMRYERAIGLVFEAQQFEARDDNPDSLTAPGELSAITSGIEIYQMFGTRTRSPRFINAGVGIAQFSIQNLQDETEFPGDGVYVSAGAGVEHFFWRSTAFDFEMKYHTLFHDGETNHALRLSAGLIFYVSY